LLVVTGIENARAKDMSAYRRIERALQQVSGNTETELGATEALAWGELPLAETLPENLAEGIAAAIAPALDDEFALPAIGQRRAPATEAMQAGIRLHAVLQALLDETDLGRPAPALAHVAARAGLALELADELFEIARAVSAHPELARFFDAAQFQRASNELEIISAGAVLRADRVVEFEDAVWVLDYKARVTAAELPAYRSQIAGYRQALTVIHAGRVVRAGLIDLSACTLIECD